MEFKNLLRSVLGVNGVPARSLATGEVLAKAGGEGTLTRRPNTTEHLARFSAKPEAAMAIVPVQSTAR